MSLRLMSQAAGNHNHNGLVITEQFIETRMYHD